MTEATAPQPVAATVAIRRYFFPPEAKAADVLQEIKRLTPDDKAELAAGAAKELGLTIKEG